MSATQSGAGLWPASAGSEALHWSARLAARFADHPRGLFPESVLRQAALVVADTVGGIVVGMAEPEFQNLGAGIPDGDQASLIGGGRRARLDDAAFLHGGAGAAVELDEGNYASNGHPGIHAVPVALAVAEAEGASGLDVLDAVIMGYEAGSRIGRANRPSRLVHSNGTWGTIGAAVAVARLRRFDAAKMHSAIAIAAGLALVTSSSTSAEGTSMRAIYTGLSARIGLLACDMAAAGFTGQLEAASLAYGQLLGTDFQPARAEADPGACWEIEQNFFKFWASCKETQGALEALEQLLDRSGQPIDPQKIDRIDIETFDEAAGLSEQSPPSALAAKFSIPFVLACRLIHGFVPVTIAQGEVFLADPDVRALAARVFVAEDTALTARVPGARITRLRLHSGGAATEKEIAGSRGDFDFPMQDGALEAKFLALTVPAWGSDRAAEAWRALITLGDAPDTGGVCRLLA